MEKTFKLKICCMGAGYVGGPTMAVIAKHCPDIKVVVVDISKEQIDAWNSDDLPIYEPGLLEIVQKQRNKNLFFTTNIDDTIRESDIIYVSVNTPTKSTGIGAGSAADTKNCEACARKIAEIATDDKIVVEKSTVPVQTAEAMTAVLNANSNIKGIKFQLLSNPEFLAEGTAIHDLEYPSRILIGGPENINGQNAVNKLVWVYSHWISKEKIITTNVWSSELSKLVANAFLAQRISSINSISALCEATGADVEEVSKAVGTDHRIGKEFLNCSIGFGGSCFLKDILNLVYLCETFHLNEVATYWKSVIQMNEYQKNRFAINMVRSMFNTVSNKKITIFGFSFKKDTGDTRESPSGYIIKKMVEEKAILNVYDPKVKKEDFINELKYQGINQIDIDKYINFEKNVYKAAENSHAIAIATEWDEFRNYNYQKMYDSMLKPAFIFDGRNILNYNTLKEIGFEVYIIGKSKK